MLLLTLFPTVVWHPASCAPLEWLLMLGLWLLPGEQHTICTILQEGFHWLSFRSWQCRCHLVGVSENGSYKCSLKIQNDAISLSLQIYHFFRRGIRPKALSLIYQLPPGGVSVDFYTWTVVNLVYWGVCMKPRLCGDYETVVLHVYSRPQPLSYVPKSKGQ